MKYLLYALAGSWGLILAGVLVCELRVRLRAHKARQQWLDIPQMQRLLYALKNKREDGDHITIMVDPDVAPILQQWLARSRYYRKRHLQRKRAFLRRCREQGVIFGFKN